VRLPGHMYPHRPVGRRPSPLSTGPPQPSLKSVPSGPPEWILRSGGALNDPYAMAAEPIHRNLYEHALLEAETLRQVVEDISSELELRPLLTRIVMHACELLRADDGSIGLYDPVKKVIRTAAIYCMPEQELGAEMAAGIGLAGAVLATGKPVVSARYGDLPYATLSELAENAVIGVPIQGRSGLLGFFGIGANPPRRFEPWDLATLERFSRHASIAIENALRYQREITRSERMALIVKVSRLISAGMQPAELVASAAQVIHQQLGYPNVVIPLLEQDWLVYRAHAGAYQDIFKDEFRVPVSMGIAGAAAQTRTAQIVNDISQDSRYVAPPLPINVTAELAVPIVLGNEVFGVINIEGHASFESEDVSSIQVIADHLAVAIKNAQLYEDAQQAAIMRERQRLARDLHDSVSQVLSSISLISQSLVPAWRKDASEGERRVQRIEELSRLAFAEMRALLRELRPLNESTTPAAPGSLVDVSSQGLEPTLKNLLAVLAPDTLRVLLDFDDYRPQAARSEEALFRICQEAVSNVVRHAGANQVSIRAAVSGTSRIRLEIADDGAGMQTHERHPNSTGLGLQTMHERAAALGGHMSIDATPGKGARLVIELPRHDR
jgi:signal transduction histidine kinase